MSRQGSWPRGFFKWITVHGHDSLAAGYTQVQNLERSIFQWANEHRPLVHDGERVTKVHPYTDGWGRLLAPEVQASLTKS